VNRIAQALEYAGGSHTLADIKAGVQTGAFQQWLGDESVIITEVLQTPRQKILNVFLAGGNLREIAVMIPLIREWAIGQGCVKAQFQGRMGWERTFLKDQGWRATATVMEVSLG
jgi:hypothetical protein